MSVMELIRGSGIDELAAMCGGCRSCATCHVYVDAAYMERLDPPSADELDLLDGSQFKRRESRLACQVHLHDTLTGLRVTIAPED
jgi:2Fe-2S ferredoxin